MLPDPAGGAKASERRLAGCRFSAPSTAPRPTFAVIDSSAILIPLRGHTYLDFVQKNANAIAALLVLVVIGVAGRGALILVSTLGWFVAGEEPTLDQRDTVMKIPGRQ
nr:hypothetical protein [Mycobacterium leprae]